MASIHNTLRGVGRSMDASLQHRHCTETPGQWNVVSGGGTENPGNPMSATTRLEMRKCIHL